MANRGSSTSWKDPAARRTLKGSSSLFLFAPENLDNNRKNA
jgi:hypothetical protein